MWLFLLKMVLKMKNWQKKFLHFAIKKNQLKNSKILISKADMASACNSLIKSKQLHKKFLSCIK